MDLTAENYSTGFLFDHELMGGVAKSTQNPSGFVGFVVRHTTGEYLGYEEYPSLEFALKALNQVKRDWVFKPVSECGENCDPENCQAENCNASECPKVLP